ncbi:MAG: PorT family protein [Muribaculaceae bacterium]|nr:PorT family protein [Muribaculaceae bacterium]
MTRFLSILLMLVAAGSVAMAQTHYDGNISVGGKAGVALSRVQFNPTVPQSFQPGAVIGVTARYIEEKHFGIIAEFNLEQHGWKETFEGTDFRYSRNLFYAELPVMSHIYFGNNNNHFFFNAGPQVGLLFAEAKSANFDVHNVESIPDFPKVNRYTQQYTLRPKNRFDYGITAGLGMEMIRSNKRSFNVEARFYYGLRDIFSNHKKDPFASSANMSLMLTLGYSYRVK